MDASTTIPAIGKANFDGRFRQVFEAAAIGMSICDCDGRILEANSAMGSLLGYDRRELGGIELWNFPGTECHDADSVDADSSIAHSVIAHSIGDQSISEHSIGDGLLLSELIAGKIGRAA